MASVGLEYRVIILNEKLMDGTQEGRQHSTKDTRSSALNAMLSTVCTAHKGFAKMVQDLQYMTLLTFLTLSSCGRKLSCIT
jgi:hypothetical protein